MEETTETKNPNATSCVIESQLRECFGRVAYSHKTHEKCADIHHGRLRRLKLYQIILAGITTGGLVGVVFGENRCAAIVAALTSTALLIINAYTKDLDLGELYQKHAGVAGDLWNVRESYLSLLTDIREGQVDLDQVRAKRDELQEELKNIYQAAPRTIPKAYVAAQQALQVNEDLTFSDAEIDSMLPTALKKASKRQ